MVYITKEEILKLAHISQLHVHDHEIDSLIKHIQDVLDYAQRVKEVLASEDGEVSHKNSNVFREDVVIPTDPEPILAQAPQREVNYFVVPAILEQK